jgi:uncharacterized protein
VPILVFFLLFTQTLLAEGLSSLSKDKLDSAPIHDLARLLTLEEKNFLQQRMQKIWQAKGPQIGFVLLKSLEGQDIESASIEIVERWKLGEDKKGNGVLFLLALEDKKMRLEVGQGLEGQMTDAQSSQIIRHVLAPYFRKKDYFHGLNALIEEIEYLTQTNSENKTQSLTRKNKRTNWSFWFYLLFLLVFVIPSSFRRMRIRGGRYYHSYGSSFPSSSGRSSWGGGGFSGGGFSGGGGGFSGGGASGSW